MKKVMVLLMSALMVFGLAACGSRDSGGSSSDSRPFRWECNIGEHSGTWEPIRG